MKPRLLLAELEGGTLASLVPDLESGGYRVDRVTDAEQMLVLAGLHPHDAIILDVTLGAPDALSVIRQVRNVRPLTPCLILSGNNQVETRVTHLDAGADDCLGKPFSTPELLARLRALLRRHRPSSDTLVRVGDLELNRVSRQARRRGFNIALTRREFALLDLLMSRSPRPVSKASIVELIWQDRIDVKSNIVNVYINKIRRKIRRGTSAPLLHTVRGVGFCCREIG